MSPELALVAPDLAESARASLPDRPWEMFAPPAALRPPRAVSAPRHEESTGVHSRRSRTGSRLAAVLALAGIVAVGALADNRELPARGIPPGLYAFGPDGRLTVAAGAIRFQATMKCFGTLVISDIPESPRGTFLVRRTFGDTGGAVTVSGMLVEPRVIRLTFEGRRGGCVTGPTSFTAHVS